MRELVSSFAYHARDDSNDVIPTIVQKQKLNQWISTMSNSLTPQTNGIAKGTPQTSFKSDMTKQHNLPPKKDTPAVRKDVSPPLWQTPLWKVIYGISFITLCISAFYMYRLTQWKAQSGGWVNLMLGRSPTEPIPSAAEVTDSAKSYTGSNGDPHFVLEDRLRELADELGMHPREFASAIKPIMPSATVTSLAQANPTPSDPVVDILAGADPDQDTNSQDTLSVVAKGLGAIMGADDPDAFET
ncbi:hypothetical protein FRB93_007050 [Tulasnella sp. JGI-2019a]|nr:hypothetical protein FRB93_007050 [Tulasnella sp. JGI-2019a]